MLPIVRERLVAAERHQRNLNLIRRRLDLRATSSMFELEDRRFIELFRLNKMLVRQLIDILTPHLLDRITRKGVSIEVKVFCALRFYATGSYQRCVGQDFNLGLSQTTVHRCIHAVSQALANIVEDHLQLPGTVNERNSLKYEFMERWGFPGVIGAIDGFHVAILKPHADEHNYMNRKGYHSLNVQIICDHTLKIRSIFANFGGATHDSFIWRGSAAQDFMREVNRNEASWLIGDSGYPLQPYLLTPIRNVENESQNRYNAAHIRARNCVERCIGLLKMRFRCLLKERSARYKPEFMCIVVKACAVLHNMCVENNIPLEEEFQDEDFPRLPAPANHPDAADGIRVRQNIVNRYFT